MTELIAARGIVTRALHRSGFGATMTRHGRRFSSLYGAFFVKAPPRGTYQVFPSSVSLFDLDSTVSSPRPTRIEEPACAEAVKDGA
jgi:hypothetical protein